MRIKVWTNNDTDEHPGPYKMLDSIERSEPYSVGELTNHGIVISILPLIPPFSDDTDQSVVVEMPVPAASRVPNTSQARYRKISILPVHVDRRGAIEQQAFDGAHL